MLIKDLIAEKRKIILKNKKAYQKHSESSVKHFKYRKFSVALRRKIRNRVNALHDALQKNKQSLIIGGVLLSFPLVYGSTQILTEENMPRIATQIPQMPEAQPITEADISEHYENMMQNGRFFVNAENDSVIYRTNHFADSLDIGVPAHIGSISQARENGIPFNADQEALQKAYGNTKGSFMGAYQFNAENVKSLILYGLVQEESETVRRLCQSTLKEGITPDHPALSAFKNQYRQSLEDIENGISSKKALNETFCSLGSNKIRNRALKLLKGQDRASLKRFVKSMAETDFEAFRQLQDDYVTKVYLPLAVNGKDRQGINLKAYAAFLAAEIHGHKSSNIANAKEGRALVLINNEANSNKKMMLMAQNNIVKDLHDGQNWYDWQYVKQCGDAGADISDVRTNLKEVVRQNLENKRAAIRLAQNTADDRSF